MSGAEFGRVRQPVAQRGDTLQTLVTFRMMSLASSTCALGIYEPETGRFISEDPARDGANWFCYSRNSPTNLADNSGKSPAILGAIGIGALLGLIAGIVNGIAVALNGGTPQEIISAILSYVVSGAVAGAIALYSPILAATIAGGLQSALQDIMSGKSVDPFGVVIGAVAGLVGAGIAGAVLKLGLNSFALSYAFESGEEAAIDYVLSLAAGNILQGSLNFAWRY